MGAKGRRISRILTKAGVKKISDVGSDRRHVEIGGPLKQASGVNGIAQVRQALLSMWRVQCNVLVTPGDPADWVF